MNDENLKISKIDFAIKAIRETILQKSDSYIFKCNNTLPLINKKKAPKGFSNLSQEKQEEIRQYSINILKKRSFFTSLFSCYKSNKKPILVHPRIFELIEHLNIHGLTTEGIFRREGNRKVYKDIVKNIDTVDFSKHNILELGSAIKHYIRDIMNGIFNSEYLSKIFEAIKNDMNTDAEIYCKYLVYTLSFEQRRLFYALRDLLHNIASNSSVNKMTWESISNILSLSICPQEAFMNVQMIPVIIRMFGVLMQVDTEDLSDTIFKCYR